MKHIIRQLFLSCLLFVFTGATAFAAPTQATKKAYVKLLMVSYDDGAVFVHLDSKAARVNPKKCRSSYYARIDWGMDERREKVLISTLQTALAAGKQVQLRIRKDKCRGAYPVFNHVYLHR